MFKDIFEGQVNPARLPESLYTAILATLSDAVVRGFGGGDLVERNFDYLEHFDRNVGVFSAAKTHQQVVDMSKAIFDSNQVKRPFPEFKKIA